MAYRRRSSRSSYGGYRRSNSARRKSTVRRSTRSTPRRAVTTRRGNPREIRIVVEQVPASPISRPQIGLLNTLLAKTNKPPRKSKL